MKSNKRFDLLKDFLDIFHKTCYTLFGRYREGIVRRMKHWGMFRERSYERSKIEESVYYNVALIILVWGQETLQGGIQVSSILFLLKEGLCGSMKIICITL